jgi:uridine kinase
MKNPAPRLPLPATNSLNEQDYFISRKIQPMPDLFQTIERILHKRREVPLERSLLVGVTGIDGSGKGYLTAQIVDQLLKRGVRTASISVDGWLNLPSKRFNPQNPAEHFYEHAIRFEEMFEQLIEPLIRTRSHHLVADFSEEKATQYRKHTYQFENLDAVVLEGIFLLKPEHRRHFDLSFWVECTFETALERALERRQEGQSIPDTIQAYQTIYFPAQRIHLARDNPKAAGDFVLINDPRIDLVIGTRFSNPFVRVIFDHLEVNSP